MTIFISSIGTATPQNRIPQRKVAELMKETLGLEEAEAIKLNALYRASGIDYRHSVLEDYTRQCGEYDFFPNTQDLEPFPTIGPRMEAYEKFALQLSLKAIEDCFSRTSADPKEITHLISVSCTGMYAPGIDIGIIEQLKLNEDVKRTCINFMGCYAAFNALKAAEAFCKADSTAKVLIVCVELCSLHFLKNKDQDQLLSNALFSDGAAAVLVESSPSSSPALCMESFYCALALEGKKDMAWHITDHGFEMTLTSYVPELIKGGISRLTQRLLKNIQLNEIDFYAIHPGGKRILEAIEHELGLSKEDNRHAYQVLKQYGNMSSPTVLFVLKSLMNELKDTDKGKKILSFAFGPGLTLESMLLRVH